MLTVLQIIVPIPVIGKGIGPQATSIVLRG